jgi:hypothetical protein
MCRANIPYTTRCAERKGDASSITARDTTIKYLCNLDFRNLIQLALRIAFSELGNLFQPISSIRELGAKSYPRFQPIHRMSWHGRRSAGSLIAAGID